MLSRAPRRYITPPAARMARPSRAVIPPRPIARRENVRVNSERLHEEPSGEEPRGIFSNWSDSSPPTFQPVNPFFEVPFSWGQNGPYARDGDTQSHPDVYSDFYDYFIQLRDMAIDNGVDPRDVSDMLEELSHDTRNTE